MSKDYYKILGVDKNASKEDIKKAFRTLAHKYHPDKKGGDEVKFKEANEAYTVLSDDTKRKQYDTFGNADMGGMGGPNAGFGGFDFSQFTQGGNGASFEFDLGDIFGDFFGGGRQRQGRNRGNDLSIDVTLSFDEAVFGAQRKITLNRHTRCDTCKGSGGKPGTEETICATCKGVGRIQETKRSFIGTFATERECETCHGKGKVPKEKCGTCNGAGTIKKQEEVTVRIPAGINDGEVVRLVGGGEELRSGTAGDLYIKVHVQKHQTFRRDGNNLVADLHIKLSEALLGTDYNLRTLDGEMKLKIPERVGFGEILRVKGKGVPFPQSSKRGDLLIRIIIDMPTKLSKDAKKAIDELRKEGF